MEINIYEGTDNTGDLKGTHTPLVDGGESGIEFDSLTADTEHFIELVDNETGDVLDTASADTDTP